MYIWPSLFHKENMRLRTLTLSFLILISYSLFSQDYTVKTVPNPKKHASSNFVSNPDGIISSEAEDIISHLAYSLEKHNGVEIAIVILNSVGDTDIKDFAVELFNTWGIGKAGIDNGLLILFVNNQRAVTFETGYGIEGTLTDIICKRIQMEHMIPYFKEGDYELGLINGMHAVTNVLEKGTYESPSSKKSFAERHYILVGLFKGSIIFFVLAFTILLTIFRYVRKGDPYKSYGNVSNLSGWALGLAIFSPLLILLYVYFQKQKKKIRVRPRPCKKCGTKINQRLDEISDNHYLPLNKAFEETIGSIDYDVWLCSSCNEAQILSYHQGSRYNQCPSCKTIAYFMHSDVILQHPTTLSQGIGLRSFLCSYCKYKYRERYNISKITESNSSSSSSSSGYSSGTSWGGGRSGGGGATSHW